MDYSSGCLDGSISVWSVDDEFREHERHEGHLVEIVDISFAPNGKWLASIDRNGRLIVRLAKVKL